MAFRYYTLIQAWPSHEISSWGEAELRDLLNAGWRPVRETPMGGNMVGATERDGVEFMFASLILLEHDDA